MISRREFAAGAAAILSMGGPAVALPALQAEFARIEKEIGARLGVAALDTHDGSMASHRTDERFPMCSTFKALAGRRRACARRYRQGATRPAHPL